MALVVGTDTYISRADCQTYLDGRYLPTDAKFVAWNDLVNDYHEILLRQALDVIEKLPLMGVKAVSTQTLQFPRSFHSDWVSPLYGYIANGYGSRYQGLYTQTSVPNDVKYAQCEIALTLAQGSSRMDLQQQGVKSYTIGKLSETFAVSGSANKIPSARAAQLLRPYLGSVVIV